MFFLYLPRFGYLFLGTVETLESPRSVAPHACCRYHILTSVKPFIRGYLVHQSARGRRRAINVGRVNDHLLERSTQPKNVKYNPTFR